MTSGILIVDLHPENRLHHSAQSNVKDWTGGTTGKTDYWVEGDLIHMCLGDCKLREGFRQISADTNCSIYLSGLHTFLPQSGPDVMWQADSCTETVKATFAHIIVVSLYCHIHRTTSTADFIEHSAKLWRWYNFFPLRFGWNPQNWSWNKSEVSKLKYSLNIINTEDVCLYTKDLMFSGPANTLFRLAVKFFPPDPGQLQEEYTRSVAVISYWILLLSHACVVGFYRDPEAHHCDFFFFKALKKL